MNKLLKQILKCVLSLVVAAILLYYSFKGVNWNDFLSGLVTCNWWLVLASMCAGALAFLFRSFRWRRIMLPIDPSIDRLTVFNAVNICNISNFVIQGIGEFVRTGIVVRRSAGRNAGEGSPRYDKILGTAILERGWDVLSLVILFVVLVIFKGGDFGAFFRTAIVEPLSEKSRGAAWALIVLVCLALLGILAAIYFLRNRVKAFRKAFDLLKGLLQGMLSCLKMKNKSLFFIYTAAIWGCYWLQMVFMIQAFPVTAEGGLTLVDALFLMLVGSISAFLPTPGGIGAYHFLVTTAMTSIYAFSKADGMVFATLAHESQALNMAIWGLLGYVIEILRKDSKPE